MFFSKYSDEELSELFALIPLVERDLLNLRLHERHHYSALEYSNSSRYPSTRVGLDEFDAYGPDRFDEDDDEDFDDEYDLANEFDEDDEDYEIGGGGGTVGAGSFVHDRSSNSSRFVPSSERPVQGSFGEQPGMDTFPELRSDPLARVRAISDAQRKGTGKSAGKGESQGPAGKTIAPAEPTKRERLLRALSSLQNATGIMHCLDRDSSRLLMLAAWHGGELSLRTLLQELRSAGAIPADPTAAQNVNEPKTKTRQKAAVQQTASADDIAINWIVDRFGASMEKLEFVGLAMPGNAKALTRRVYERPGFGIAKVEGRARTPVEPINLEHPVFVLYPDVARTVKLPGQSIANLLGVSANETISKWLVANGLKPVGTKRFELSYELLNLFGSRTAMTKLVSTLSVKSVGLLNMMLSTLGQVNTDRLGVSYYRPGYGASMASAAQFRPSRYDTAMRGYRSPGRRFGMGPEPATPAEKAEEHANALALDELFNRGLIGYDAATQSVWVWREVGASLRPHFIVDWSLTSSPQLGALASDGRSQAFIAAESVDTIHRHWFKNPPDALTDGSIGVATIRAASKVLKFDPQTVTLVTALLVDDSRMRLGITGTSGRGRNKVAIYGWEVDDPSAARAPSILISGAPGKRAEQKVAASGVGSDGSAFGGIAFGGVVGEAVGGAEFLWRRRVFQWLHNDVMDETETFSPRISRGRKQSGTLRRTMILRILESLGHGLGAVNESVLCRWICDQHLELLSVEVVESVLAACKSLGLVPRSGPIGLTNAARELLNDGQSILRADESTGPQLIIGGDQTIVAPPETPHQVLELLGRFCDLSSDAGVRMYRLSETKLGAAFGAGQHANDLIDVLRTNAKTPVPQSVEFLIHDVQRRHGRILVSSAVTVITSDDAALLVQAVNVKAAALSLLSPSVAVSLLPAAKVFNALEAKGLLPAMFTGTGTVKGIGATSNLDSIQVSSGEPALSVSTNATRQRALSKPHSESAPPIAIQPLNYRSIQTIQADIANAGL
jgi:Helicase conserved C-terminal domain